MNVTNGCPFCNSFDLFCIYCKPKPKPVACRQCGVAVEHERETYATPVCFKCLPPPKPLPVRCTVCKASIPKEQWPEHAENCTPV